MFLERMQFRLPVWAAWSPDDWRAHRLECGEVIENRLGWDITDFGGGDFVRRELVLFTLRNGHPGRDKKPQAEKVMVESFDPEMERIAKLTAIWRKLADSPEALATEGLVFLKATYRYCMALLPT